MITSQDPDNTNHGLIKSIQPTIKSKGSWSNYKIIVIYFVSATTSYPNQTRQIQKEKKKKNGACRKSVLK